MRASNKVLGQSKKKMVNETHMLFNIFIIWTNLAHCLSNFFNPSKNKQKNFNSNFFKSSFE